MHFFFLLVKRALSFSNAGARLKMYSLRGKEEGKAHTEKRFFFLSLGVWGVGKRGWVGRRVVDAAGLSLSASV